MTRPLIAIASDTDRLVTIRPSSFLGPEDFARYREATERADFDRKRSLNVLPVEKLASVTKRLREAGFAVDMTPEARKHLQRYSAAQMFDLQRVRERIDAIDKEIYDRQGDRLYWWQKTAAEWLTLRSAALLADEMGVGKAQPVSEPVLTPTGWKAIGSLKTGDEVIGSDGMPTKVTGVFPQGVRQIYRVWLTDGTSARCDLEHLWSVSTPNSRFRRTANRVMTLREILSQPLRNPSGNSKWFVPVPDSALFDYPSRDLGLAPYLLGALIANGGLTSGTPRHSGTDEQRQEILKYLPKGYQLRGDRREPSCTYRITKGGRSNLVQQALVKIGCAGKRSYEKEIPREYLFAPAHARLELLAGLMDNDGTVSKNGKVVEYNTTSPKLAENVLFLVRSLGCTAWMTTRIPKYTYLGRKLEGKKDHRIRMALTFNPFKVFSKARKFTHRSKYPPSRAIDRVDKEGREESVCIAVEAADRLYVTRDFIVTHNTNSAIVAIPPSAPVVVVCPAKLKGIWTGEIKKWRPLLRASILEGRDSFRWPREGEIAILNYEILPDVHDRDGVKGRVCKGVLPLKPCPGCYTAASIVAGELITIKVPDKHLPSCKGTLKPERCPGCAPFLDNVPEGVVLIADEAHLLKTRKATRTLRFRTLAAAIRKAQGKTWGMTGTPLENSPTDLYNVYRSLGIDREAFGSYDGFVELFKGVRTGERETIQWPKLEAEDEERIRPRIQSVSMRRTRKEVLPFLPAMSYREIDVDIDKKTYARCEAWVKQCGGIERALKIIEESKGEDVKIEGLSSLRLALAVAKIPAMLEFIETFEEQNEPLVVFSVHRAPIEALIDRPGWAVIIGGSGADASDIQRRFQAGELLGVGMTLAGGTGLTLTRANQMLRVDRDWRPTVDDQVESRLLRIGQERGVLISTLVSNHPLEARVIEIHRKKRNFVDRTVDAASLRDQGAFSADEEIRLVQKEAAQGRAARRIANGAAETLLVKELHEMRFEDSSDERIASELAQEASMIGLTEAQWRLAWRVVKRAKGES